MIDETIENTEEAIESYLVALKENDLEIPVEEDLFIGKVRVGTAAT
jgi:predicted RNase H-like HicB family nuclease